MTVICGCKLRRMFTERIVAIDEGGMPGRCRTAVGLLLSVLRSPMGLRRHVRFDRRYTGVGERCGSSESDCVLKKEHREKTA